MKLIQDADEAEKILDRALHAPDQEVDDSLVSSKKFLYSDSMEALIVRTASRKSLQLGRRIPKLELIADVVKLCETSLPEVFSSLSNDMRSDFKKQMSTKIDDYTTELKKATETVKKSKTSVPEKHLEDNKKSFMSALKPKAKPTKAPGVAAATIAISNSSVRQLSELIMQYLKTLAAFVGAAAVKAPDHGQLGDLKVDLYSIANQVPIAHHLCRIVA